MEYKEYEHGPGFFDSELASAIMQEKDRDKQKKMVAELTEEEAKIFCELLLYFVKK